MTELMNDDGYVCRTAPATPGLLIKVTGLRRHRIKNTSNDLKGTQRPCLVQTEALLDEDGCLSLQE